MFTGLIEEIGTIVRVKHGSKSSQLSITADKVLTGIKTGDSICTNGVCLTVIRFDNQQFTVDVMAETIRITNLKDAKQGIKVNLERALKVGDRLGGHIVTGHIDGMGTIRSLVKEDNAVWVNITAEADVLKYIIPKGSISVDGISLTVAYVDDKQFKVSIIPHTGEETTLLHKKPGEKVNLETDLLGKYIEKLLFHKENQKEQKRKIDMSFLSEHGFA